MIPFLTTLPAILTCSQVEIPQCLRSLELNCHIPPHQYNAPVQCSSRECGLCIYARFLCYPISDFSDLIIDLFHVMHDVYTVASTPSFQATMSGILLPALPW